MKQQLRSSLSYYIFAVLSVVLALLLTQRLEALTDRTLFGFLFAAVAISTWYGGRWAGLLAILLATLGTSYILAPAGHFFPIKGRDLWQLGTFAGVALLINWLMVSRQRTSAALGESETRLRLGLNAAKLGTWDYHPDTGQVLWDERGARHYGEASPPPSFDDAIARIHPEDREMVNEAVRRAVAGQDEGVYRQEFRVVWSDGSVHWLAAHGQVYFKDEGNNRRVERFIGVNMDITERKHAEERLRAADRRAVEEYERLLDRLAQLALTFGTARELLTIYRGLRDFSIALTPSFGLVICLYDEVRAVREGVYFYVDGAEIEAPEVPPVPVRSGPAGQAIKTGTAIISSDYVKDLGDRAPVHVGFATDNKDPRSALIAPMTTMGRTVGTIEVQSHALAAYTREHATAMQMAANLAANAIENVRLLQLEREKEEQLRQSQKMEAVGQLAGGIAHDFNNLLTAITGYSDLLIRRLAETDPLRRNVEEIKKAGERAAALTRQLLAFSRKQILQPKVIDLNVLVTDVSRMLRRLIGEDVEMVTVLRPDVGRIEADPGQIEQVVMNLAVNARDAMPKGGRLTIETANVELDEAFAGLHIAVRPGPYVLLAVSDTGMGMDAETRARIFEPFFTTKEVGRGTGLGLATVYGIIKQSGGNIWVYSEPGQGTTFKVYLPRVAQTEAPVVEPRAAAPRGTETILLVEDEAMVSELAQAILQQSGYEVLAATDGEAALRLLAAYERPIHLLLTDVVMPFMSGKELATRVLALRPKMKVLYMSGYTDEAIVHHGVLEPGVALLEKPFTPAALAQKVRAILDESE